MQSTSYLRIADLADPILTPAQRAAMAAAQGQPVSLTEDAVLSAARQATGLSDFGPDDFRVRLGVWLQAGEEDRGLNAFGRKVLFQYCVRYAANRLRIEHLYKRHPEIEEIEIRRPIFIAGLPRSGTTHLVNLLACDSRLRSLPYWEAVQPVPDVGEDLQAAQADPRQVRCQRDWEQLNAVLPHLRAMHEMSPDHIHEDLELQAIDFSTYNIEWTAHVPRWRDWYLTHDRQPHYRYLKKVLKALQWLRGPDRWLLKCPQHIENLPALIGIFPDATVIITHRDPVEVIQSTATAICYGDRVRRSEIRPRETANYWIDRIERMLRACVRDRDVLPTALSLDVFFDAYMRDEMETVEQVYKLAGLSLTDNAHATFVRYQVEHPRGKHGRVVYDMARDFGYSTEEVRERFGFYFERFPQLGY